MATCSRASASPFSPFVSMIVSPDVPKEALKVAHTRFQRIVQKPERRRQENDQPPFPLAGKACWLSVMLAMPLLVWVRYSVKMFCLVVCYLAPFNRGPSWKSALHALAQCARVQKLQSEIAILRQGLFAKTLNESRKYRFVICNIPILLPTDRVRSNTSLPAPSCIRKRFNDRNQRVPRRWFLLASSLSTVR